MTPTRYTYRQVLRRLAQIGLAVFIALVLWSYAPGDAGFSKSGAAVAANWGGSIGAWFADFLYFFLGYVAWLLPLWLIYESSRGLFFARLSAQWPHAAPLRMLAWLLLCYALVTQGAWWQQSGGSCTGEVHALPCGAGGWLGLWLFPRSVDLLGALGAQLFLWVSILMAFSLITGLSWLRAADWIGMGVWRVLGLDDPARMPEVRREPTIIADPIAVSAPGEPDDSGQFPVGPEFTPPPKRAGFLNRLVARTQTTFGRASSGDAVSGWGGSALPGIDLLQHGEPCAEDTGEGAQLQHHMETLLGEFGVNAQVVHYSRGPVITHFEVQPSAGVKASRISALATDLARSLRVGSVRVVEVSPGKSTVGIEIPNRRRSTIGLRTLFESDVWHMAHSSLSLALGVDIFGNPVVANLDSMPHLLIAGTTGSGKSVGVNAMLLSILYKALPHSVRLLLIDPKMLELSVYDGIPHLLSPVITDMKDAVSALRWCLVEMERRYRLIAALGVRDIKGYNDQIIAAAKGSISLGPAFESDDGADFADPNSAPGPEPLPLIVVVIDEFADMMMAVGRQIEELIIRLAQKARAAGIHLVLATQRPSVDVITGLIKANIPSRIAYQVSSRTDSRTVLDQNGAENLLGNGDMLYMRAGRSSLLRLHGAMVYDEEVHRVVDHYKRTAQPDYLESVLSPDKDAVRSALPGSARRAKKTTEQDALYEEALNAVVESGRASASFVQRRFRIGYNRAARLLEQMEERGVVSAMNSNGSREILSPYRTSSE